MPDWTHFLKKRDFIAALALLECDKKYSHRHDLKTYLGIAYCAFHNGDYKYDKSRYIHVLIIGRRWTFMMS